MSCCASTSCNSKHNMEGLSIAQLRSAALTEAFGDKGAAFESNYNELLKANFDACELTFLSSFPSGDIAM
jgi:hypothetical protein